MRGSSQPNPPQPALPVLGRSHRIGRVVIAASFVALCGAGCRTSERAAAVPNRDKAASLSEVARAYWTARGGEAWETLYAFQPPAIQAETTVEEYIAWATGEEPFRIHDWSIQEWRQQGDLGWVRVDYTATLRRFETVPPKTTTHWQRWVRRQGAWYPVPQGELDQYPESPAERDLPAERTLRSRFDQTWTARSNRDWSALYDLTDPRDHAAVALEQFVESESLFVYLDATVHWTEAIGNRGRIRVTYQHKPADPNMTKLPTQRATIIERWVIVDGEWYRDLIHQ